MSKKLSIVLVALLLAVALVPGTATADSSKPVRLTFEKQIVHPNGIWEGSVGGDVEGDLTTVLRELRVAGPIWHVTFDWIVDADDDNYDFTARLYGILNTDTGSVVMDGTVTEGWSKGAQVHEEGQLVAPATYGFEGTIRIMPATAN
jgi:hypothetical protein